MKIMTNQYIQETTASLKNIHAHEVYGTVTKVLGLMVEIKGFGSDLTVGSRVTLQPAKKPAVPCEVIGFEDKSAVLLPFGSLDPKATHRSQYATSRPPRTSANASAQNLILAFAPSIPSPQCVKGSAWAFLQGLASVNPFYSP